MGTLSALKAKKPRMKIGFEVRERMARYKAGGLKGSRKVKEVFRVRSGKE